jgi:hypothetical protein
MNPLFSVGEIAILKNLTVHAEYNGTEVLVIGGLAERDVRPMSSNVSKKIWCYHIKIPDFMDIAALPHQLKKKQPPLPPKEETIPWSDCIFQPVALRKKEVV